MYKTFANFVHEYKLFFGVEQSPGKRSGPFSFDKPFEDEHPGPPFSQTRIINVSRYTIDSWQTYLWGPRFQTPLEIAKKKVRSPLSPGSTLNPPSLVEGHIEHQEVCRRHTPSHWALVWDRRSGSFLLYRRTVKERWAALECIWISVVGCPALSSRVVFSNECVDWSKDSQKGEEKGMCLDYVHVE